MQTRQDMSCCGGWEPELTAEDVASLISDDARLMLALQELTGKEYMMDQSGPYAIKRLMATSSYPVLLPNAPAEEHATHYNQVVSLFGRMVLAPKMVERALLGVAPITKKALACLRKLYRVHTNPKVAYSFPVFFFAERQRWGEEVFNYVFVGGPKPKYLAPMWVIES
jgi:hypothetical protein